MQKKALVLAVGAVLMATGAYAQRGGGSRGGAEPDSVVELYGKDRVPSDPESLKGNDGTAQGLCCPTLFTRSRYGWNGRSTDL